MSDNTLVLGPTLADARHWEFSVNGKVVTVDESCDDLCMSQFFVTILTQGRQEVNDEILTAGCLYVSYKAPLLWSAFCLSLNFGNACQDI